MSFDIMAATNVTKHEIYESIQINRNVFKTVMPEHTYEYTISYVWLNGVRV